MTAALLLAAVAFAPPATVAPPATRAVELTPTDGFADNPLKGFVPFRADYTGDDGEPVFPHGLEFQYVKLSDLMDGPGSFTFETGLEPILNDVAGRGHRLVLRPYLDYPDTPGTGVPKFLLDAGLKMRRYKQFGGGRSPDYEDERLVTALEAFIRALGERYDGDPRLGVVQTGLLGHWGEWHTYPHDDWFASEATQRRVLAAYDAAFRTTPTMVRYPSPVTLNYPLGFYDDSFAFATLPTGRAEDDWFYLAKLKAEGGGDVWKTEMVGGEVRPEVQPVLFADAPKRGRVLEPEEYLAPDEAAEKAQDFAECVRETHASWLINQHLFRGVGFEPGEKDRAVAAAKSLGYRFTATRAEVSRNGSRATVRLTFRNRGVAPFYHDWPARVGLFAADGAELAGAAADWELSKVLPGTEVTKEATFALPETVPAGATVGILIPDPLPGARPLRFANTQTDGHGVLRLGAVP